MTEAGSVADATPAVMSIESAVAALQRSRESAPAPTPEPEAIDDGADDAEPNNRETDSDVGEADFASDEVEEEAADSDEDGPDAEEEPEAEDADEGDDEEEAQSEEEAAKHRLRIGDEELEVTTEELKAGYLRDRDYRQKTQALSAARKEFEATAQQTEADRRQYREKAAAYEQLLKRLDGVVDVEGKAFENIDWAKLKADDPAEYLLKRDEFSEYRNKQAALKSEQERMTRERQKEAEAETQKARRALNEALFTADYFPHWQTDEATMKADIQAMEATALELGFGREELSSTLDPRAWKLLHEAAQYRKLKTGKPMASKPGTPAKGKNEGTKPAPAVRVLKSNAARPAPQTGQAATANKVASRLRSGRPIGGIDEAFELYRTAGRARRA
jgi:hypothetical protein